MSDDLEARLKDLLADRGRVGQDEIDRAIAGIDALPRPRRQVATPLAMAAAVVLAVVGVALLALVRPGEEIAGPPSSAPTDAPRSTLQPRPIWAVDLASHLDCDGPPSSIGMDTDPDPVPFDTWPTPAEALDDHLAAYSSLPTSGFTPPLVDGHWALQRYLVAGRPKVHVVSTNQFPGAPAETGWQVVGLRACDASEFGP